MCDQDHFDDDTREFDARGFVTRAGCGRRSARWAGGSLNPDRCARVHCMAGSPGVCCEESEDRHARLLHGWTDLPNEKAVLKDAFANTNVPAEIEVYEGAAHGWCPPDSGVYYEPQAEKAWGRLLAVYGKALA